MEEYLMERKHINRREFMGRTGLGLMTAGLGLPFIKTGCTSLGQSGKLISRTLGRTKMKIPVVSFGVMNTHSEPLILKAIEVGVNHLDTANVYLNGNSELAIGRVLTEHGLRKKVSIATKMYFARDSENQVFVTEGGARGMPATEDNFEEQLKTSLERLQTDYVDILYLHNLYSAEMVNFEPMVKALTKAKESGKTRFLGASTHMNVPEVTRAAVDAGIYDVVEIAYNYMSEGKEEIRESNKYAAENGVGIVAMKVMGGNRLNQDESVQINHKAALKWVLSDPNVTTTIPGMTTFDQLDLNMSVLDDLTLTEDEKRELKITSMLEGKLYCQNCRSCVATCSEHVQIPDLMRAYMYAEGYGNTIQAELTVAELPLRQGLEVCRSCSHCTSVCRHGIPIKTRVQSLMDRGFSGIASV
jgi:predicted aldo/keto reductase-like oxidoreductase